jgi:hypothetical protein
MFLPIFVLTNVGGTSVIKWSKNWEPIKFRVYDFRNELPQFIVGFLCHEIWLAHLRYNLNIARFVLLN